MDSLRFARRSSVPKRFFAAFVAFLQIERKTFHACGLGFPLLFSLVVEFGQDFKLGNEAERTWLFICVSWVGTAAIWIGDILRLSSPRIAAHLPLSEFSSHTVRSCSSGTNVSTLPRRRVEAVHLFVHFSAS
eukprot:SAG31_NODE_6232_length_2108_cov_4.496267_2_plen_132_part_00